MVGGVGPRDATEANHEEKKMRVIQGLIAAGLLALLAACNTVGGMGQDLQEGGEAISDTAQDTEQAM